jgi:tyrosyl-tRNA synthetase
LTSKFTVAQFLAREDFNNRFKAGKPIAITEFLYPLLQAYDSVAVQSDVEFGGQDQKFNFLVGRELQTMLGQRPQQCFMTSLLVGTDGVHKMSKSLGNYIGVDEAPNEIYGKVMALADNMIIQYFELLTDVTDSELADFRRQISGNTINPMVLKKRLALELVAQLHSTDDAIKADEHFTNVFQKREMPEEITEIEVVADEDIRDIITRANIAKSRSDAGRLLQQGAISIDGIKVMSGKTTYQNGNIIKVGKHHFIKVVLHNK